MGYLLRTKTFHRGSLIIEPSNSKHRKPDLSDLYLIHQQGWEGAAEHISQPDRVAWKSMCATSEGREKGEKWCKIVPNDFYQI